MLELTFINENTLCESMDNTQHQVHSYLNVHSAMDTHWYTSILIDRFPG